MSSCTLISDSSIPFAVSLTGHLQDSGFGLLCEPAPDSALAMPSTAIPWNRGSSLSARTVILDMKNKFSSFDRALLIFDTAAFSEVIPDMDTSSAVRCTDEYVRGYLLLVAELIKYFRQQKTGLIVFALRSPAPGSAKVSVPVAVAESAFMRLAEETASSLSNGSPSLDTGLQTLLVKLDPAEDSGNLEWLSLQLASPLPVRTQARWVKAGSRNLFGKL
jgi:hypothetical protein